jgi:NADH:ubiquinone oxidoreductase subunit 2 (subunit N)
MMLLPGARDLILLVVSFELMGIPLYVLDGVCARRSQLPSAVWPPPSQAAEAGLKLYLVGGSFDDGDAVRTCRFW